MDASTTVRIEPIDFNDIYERKLFSDVVLESLGGKRYYCHKIILAASSDYFMALFGKEFKDPGMIILIKIEEKILNLYLQLIYKRSVKIANWKDGIALVEFMRYTQTKGFDIEELLHDINVPTEEYSDFITMVIEFYQGDVPLEFISRMMNFNINNLNYKNLGEEFTRELIQARGNHDELTKYYIAQKAVKDGLDPSIYRLVQFERLYPGDITPESKPYLKRIDENLLDKHIAISNKPFTAAIIKVEVSQGIFSVLIRGKFNDDQIVVDFLYRNEYSHKDDEDYELQMTYPDYNTLSEDLIVGNIINVTKYHFHGLNIIVDAYKIIEY